MTTARRKGKSPSKYMRLVLSALENYETTTGDDSGDLIKAAKWLYENKEIRPPKFDPIKAVARILASASAQDVIVYRPAAKNREC